MEGKERKKPHHHWKLWLSLILIAGIVGLLFYTDTLNFAKIGNFVGTVSPPPQTFPIQLEVDEQTFYSQSLTIFNTSFAAEGVCQQGIKINDITLSKEGAVCKANFNSLSGSFDFTAGGSLIINGEVESMKIDDVSYSSGKPMKIVIQMVPTKFLLSDLSLKSINLPTASGKIAKLRGDGASVIGMLDKEPVEISNFIGYLKLEDGKVFLTGEASSVKSQEFKW